MNTLTEEYIKQHQNENFVFCDYDIIDDYLFFVLSKPLIEIIPMALQLTSLFTNQKIMDDAYGLISGQPSSNHISIKSSYFLLPINDYDLSQINSDQGLRKDYLQEHKTEAVFLGCINS